MEVVAGTLKLTSGDPLLEGPCICLSQVNLTSGDPLQGGHVDVVARLKLTSGDPLLGGALWRVLLGL